LDYTPMCKLKMESLKCWCLQNGPRYK